MNQLELFDSSILQKIQTARSLSMRGDQEATLYQLEEANRAIVTLCNRLSQNQTKEPPMSPELPQAKRRRTDSKAIDSEIPTASTSPSGNHAPMVAHSQSATTSPLPISQPPLPHYSATTLAMANPSLSYPYQYSHPAYSASQQYVHEQQRAESASTQPVEHHHLQQLPPPAQQQQQQVGSIYSAVTAASSSADAMAMAVANSRALMTIPVCQPAVLPAITASISTPASVTTVSTTNSVSTPHLQQPFTLLAQSPSATSPDYSMLLYQQQMSSADRSMTVTGGLASSTSVSPTAQHALAPAAAAHHQYQMHGQLDGQMRYMSVPSQQHQHMQHPHMQHSSLPKPIAPVNMDRFRQPSQSGLAPMQQYTPQQHYFQHVNTTGQMSGMGLSNTMRQSSYPGIHASAGAHIPSGQQSVAQVAAAVAAAAAAHTIPIPNAGAAGRLGITVGMEHQGAISELKFSAMDMQSVASEQPMPDYLEDYTQSYMPSGPPILEPSSASPTEQTLDLDLVSRLDELFMKYLEQICSNNITVDSEGESIHQTQMAKKLEKLEQCTEYRTFRFRIQAFSNAYREFIEREAGMTEQVVSKQQLRNYLHQQRYISRFNEDGKKAKSKGHHVWNVEAKKISRNSWWFKEFVRRIASPPPKAVIGVPYEWTPTIWDPQVRAPKVYFHSPWLPAWLRWESNSLRGIPPSDAADCNINVVASYYQGKEVCRLETPYTLHVVPNTQLSMFIP